MLTKFHLGFAFTMKTIMIHREDKDYGPYSLEEAKDLLSKGVLIPDDLAWVEGGDECVRKRGQVHFQFDYRWRLTLTFPGGNDLRIHPGAMKSAPIAAMLHLHALVDDHGQSGGEAGSGAYA